ncbi:Karilysin [Tannerella forsythia]|uniref:trypsin-like peptidase domain-containing protein n=1 Tax=Tannerella forsythia TaxID=28112 RepID=UPI000868DC10|nr:trypsin-like peptidase domain-containing protein [Tannerella forsythia]SCQ19822.1 Karilysin [Tannerella forsythia]
MKKTIFSILGYLFFIQFLSAQITTHEAPFSFGSTPSQLLRSISTQELSAPDMAIIRAEDKVNDTLPGGPLRFAYPVKVHYTLANSGVWQTLKDGGKLWRLKIRLPGALSTNALYDKFRLPKGAKFYVYSEETRQSIGAITSEYLNNESNGAFEFSTGLIYGETVTFEYYQPETVREEAIISIARIDYGYRYVNNPYTPRTRSFDDSGDCQVNVNCPEGADWRMEKDAIARIMVVSDYGSGWCSCSLVNNTNNDNAPYVLTADHCLQNSYGQYLFDAISNPNASRWVFYWGYEHPGCSDGNEPAHRSTVGATVVANNGSSDFALLRLTQDPRNLTGFTPYYLGWDRSGNSGTGGVGIHHPSGDVKKISTYRNVPISTAYGSNSPNNSATHWRITWSATEPHHGVTEGGSSGSPLLNNDHRVIGQLHGGLSSCSSLNSPDWYGKFSVSWTGNGATDSRRRLRDWLDPQGINSQTLNGIGVLSISGPSSVCDQATYTVENLPAGAIVEWSVSNPNVATISNNGVLQVTNQTFALTNIQANIFTGGENPYTIRKERVMTGQPKFEIQPLGYSGSNFASFFLTPQGEYGDLQSIPLNYRWSYTKIDGSGYTLIGDYQNTSFLNIEPVVTFPGPGTYMITVQITGYPCYIPLVRYKHSCGSNFFTLSPNPATDEVTLQLMETDEVSGLSVLSTDRSAYEIQLWSGMTMLRSFRTNEPTFQIPMAGLPAGLYFVRVVKDGQTHTQKLIKK